MGLAYSYVMSDLHGEYGKFLKMLQVIGFQSEDTLYVLGDMVDRGPEPIRLLQDLAMRENAICLLGNHEYMALRTLRTLEVEVTADNWDRYLTADKMRSYVEWMYNGGEVTLRQYRALPREEREAVADFLGDLSLYETVQAGGRRFVLVHAGFDHFDPARALDSYAAEELIFVRTDYDQPYFPDLYTVTGHTPTLSVWGKPKIYRKGRHINVDCGACFATGRLGCLCLDTMEEFYV